MRKYLVLFVLFVASISVSGQVNCESNYKKYLNRGKALYEKGLYNDAARAFSSAADCPNNSASQIVEIKKWVDKCHIGINGKAHKVNDAKKEQTTGSSTTTNAAKPDVEILYSSYLKATCNDGVRGALLELLLTAKNIRGNRLRLCCFVTPQGGTGRVNKGSALASQYTLEGGRSGVEQSVRFLDGEECASVTVFVPFSVMDFAGDYSPQMVDVDLSVYQEGNKKPIADFHKTYVGLSPHTITVSGYTKDYKYDAESYGGLLDVHPSVCGGNDILWKDVPDWITIDQNYLRVSPNNSSLPRSAVLHVSSSEGGNVVNVRINQEGGTGTQGTAVNFNKVWHSIENTSGSQKIVVHVACDVVDAIGKEVRAYAVFYKPDGETPLLGSANEHLRRNIRVIADYSVTEFDDLQFSIGLNTVSKASRGNTATYYICFSEDKGKTWFAKSGPYTVSW